MPPLWLPWHRSRAPGPSPGSLVPTSPGRLLLGAHPLEGQHLVGIITERDVTAAMAEGADPATTPVSDYMTPAPEVLQPDSELADATQLMLELGIRHLPVVRGGHLVGVLSIRDLLDAEVHPAGRGRAG